MVEVLVETGMIDTETVVEVKIVLVVEPKVCGAILRLPLGVLFTVLDLEVMTVIEIDTEVLNIGAHDIHVKVLVMRSTGVATNVGSTVTQLGPVPASSAISA